MSRIGSAEGLMSPLPARLLGRRRSVLRRYGYADRERAAFRAGVVPALNLAAVGAHNPVTDAQAEPAALAGLFRGVEGVADALDCAHASSVVAHRRFDPAFAMPRLQVNLGAAPGRFRGVISGVQQVEKDLLQLLGIAHDGRQVFLVILDDFNPMTDEIVAAQLG